MATPKLLFWKTDFRDSVLKKFRASNALLRKNSNADPCKRLVPERVMIFTTDPLFLPYSAANCD